MLKTRAFGVLIIAVASLVPGLAAAADKPPVLAVLEYSDGSTTQRAEIRHLSEPVPSPFASPLRVWTVREGDTLKQEFAPAARFIQLYYQSGDTPQLLCNLIVRYVQGPKGWRPSYLLMQQSPVIWDGEKLTPRSGIGSREPVNLLKPTGPAGDGFFYNLSFGLASGATRITAWQVQ